jgi:sugar phosphate isomerase/epimerase
MRTAVTVCRVAESATGPFVFHDPLDVAFAKARSTGFDAVELFLPGPDAVPTQEILELAETFSIGIAAVGTGAGMVKHGLSLTDPDSARRLAARGFLESMIRFAGELGAPAILGSMQGRHGGNVPRNQALAWLAESLQEAGSLALRYHVPFLYEPLNRYETNLIHRLEEAKGWLEGEGITNVLLLADLFHMNIEEGSIPAAIRAVGQKIGHVHFADSNRHAMGFGHTDAGPAIAALREVGYTGYLSAEIFPLPDAESAAAQTITTLKRILFST